MNNLQLKQKKKMKKVESLKLNKFKKYELSKEHHNMVLGGWKGNTTASNGCVIADNYDDSSKHTINGVTTWEKKDVSVAFVAPVTNGAII